MSENELRPCPFCPDGGDLQLVTFTGGADDVINCHVCGTILKHKIWQTRPIEDELQKRITELESDNAMLKQPSQPIEFWSDEKIRIYKSSESRTMKSGYEESEE